MASQFSIKLSVSAADLIKSIKQTIDDINSSDKLKNKPLNISVSAAKLRENIRSAINEINASGKLNNTPVKLKVKLDTIDAIKNLKKELSSLTLKAGGTNVNSTALSQSINNTTNAIKNQGAAVQAVNNLLREQKTLFLKSGNIERVQTFGSAGNTITNTFLNGNQTTQTTTIDYARQQREADRVYAAYQKLDSVVNKLQADFLDLNSTKPIKDQAHIDEINVALSETRNKIKLVETASAESFSRVKSDAESAVESLKLFIKTRQNEEYAASQLRAKDVPTVKAIQTNYFDELKAKINSSRVPLSELTNDLNILQMLLNNITDRNSLTAYLNQLSITEAKFDNLKAKAKETSDFSKQIQSDINRLNKLTSGTIFKNNESNAEVVNLRAQIQALIEKYQALKAASANSNTPEQMAANIKSLRALQAELDIIARDTDRIKENLRNTRIDSRLQTQIASLHAQITEFIQKNGRAMNVVNPASGLTFGTELKNIQAALPTAQDVATFNDLNGQFVILQSNLQAAGLTGNTFFTELTNKAKKFISWFGVTFAVTKARMYFNKLFTTVYELDTALIDLKKTFRGTDEELNQFYFNSNKLAKQLGVTTAEIIQQGAAWSRLSYSSKDAMETMAAMSSMFAAISPDMDVSAATDGLISIMKAFKIAPDNVLDGILSKVNVVGNTRATSNGEIVEMLQKSSAAMREANNTLEQTIALETAAVEITRDSASTGTAWKTISARLRGLDEETLQVSDDIVELTGKFADFTKTAKTPGGISVFTDESRTTYKSTYQIIKELSEIWDDLTDVQTARIEEVMGGKRQLQVVSAAISNFEAAEEAMDSMANAAGNAEAEMDVVRESAAYAFNELKETFTSLAQNSVTRDFLKDIIKTGTGAIEVVDKLVSSFGALPTVLSVIIGQMITMRSIKQKGLFKFNDNNQLTFQGASNFKEWANNLKTNFLGAFNGKTVEYQNNLNLINDINNALSTNADTTDLCTKASQSHSLAVRNLGERLKDGKATTNDCTAAQKQLNAEFKNSSIALKALNAALSVAKMALNMFVVTIISMLIGKLIQAIDDSIHAVENLNKEFKDLASESKTIADELKNINDELKTTKEKIAELEALPKLTLLQEDELEALKAYNDELERQREEREKEARQNEIKAHENAEKLAKKIFLAGSDPRIPKSDIIDSNNELIESKIKTYKKFKEELKALEGAENRDTNKINKKRLELEEIEYELLDIEKSLKNINENLLPSDKNMNKILDYSKNLIQQWNTAYGAIPNTLKELYESAQFSKTIKQLEDLASAGELTAEKFAKFTNEEVTGIEEFKKALENIDGATFEKVVELIIINAGKAKENLDDATTSVEKFAAALEKLEDILSKQETLADVFQKIQLNGFISPKEAKELIKEIPDLLDYLERTSEGYTISAENIKAANKDITESEKEKLEDQIATIRTQISDLEQLRKLGIELNNSNGQDIDLIDKYFEQSDKTEDLRKKLGIESFSEIPSGIKKLEEELKKNKFQLDLLDESFDGYVISDIFDDAKTAISNYNNEIKTLDNAIKSLNEGTLLSYEEMTELVGIVPQLEIFFDEDKKMYSASAESIEEWRKKSFEARNEYIDGLLERAKAELQAAKNTKETCEIMLNIQKKFGDEAEQLAAQIELDSAETLIKEIEDAMSVFQAMKGNLTDTDTNKSVSDELQNNIDYYKNFISAVEIMRDKYTDAIDEEIDALEEVKNQLKENNDERQRELDLIEARNNLENAKKRKVYVYTEGEGFKQVQDKAAVKEAEEKYRDVITDIQVAEIDKEIEIREKQKEALEENTKALTELEKNIEDALTIEQAKAALGITDDKDLLDLPESVKNDIIGGLADAKLQKDIEENKDNTKHMAVTLDDILKELGSTKTAADLSPDITDNFKQTAYKNTVQGFSESMGSMANNMINNTNTYNNPNMTNNITINGADLPETRKAVSKCLTEFWAEYYNSIK